MVDRGESLALEIQRLIAETKTNGASITAIEGEVAAITPVPAPFAGAGSGDGLVGDPGGAPTGTAYLDDTGAFSTPAGGSGDMLAANNLSDLTVVADARDNLGLGTLATQDGTFSGTSSGTNTGDQDLSGYELLSHKAAASGYASLDGSSKVVQNPASATTTPAVNSIPVSDPGVGEINVGWVPTGTTLSKGVLRLGSSSGQACEGNDSRLSDSRAPNGSAGGDLTGTYPNPTFSTSVVTAAAKTVLDDATVNAMVDTLGGTAAQGTGAIVRATTPTITSPVFAAGSASAASWPKMTSGTVMTTAEDGAIELDADCFYGCTDAGNRGYLPVRHFIRADITRNTPSDTNLNAIFNSPANGRLTLETGTYLFEMQLQYSGMSATSGNVQIDILGAGGATMATVLWNSWAVDASTTTTPATNQMACQVTKATGAAAATAGTGTGFMLYARGSFEITVAGTIVPSEKLLTAAAATLAAGSFFMCERIGSTSVVSVGQWD